MTPRAIKALVSRATGEWLASGGSRLKTMQPLQSNYAGAWRYGGRHGGCIADPDSYHWHHHRPQRRLQVRAGQPGFAHAEADLQRIDGHAGLRHAFRHLARARPIKMLRM